MIETYRGAGGKGEIVLLALVSWAETDEQALEGAIRVNGEIVVPQLRSA